MTIHVENGAIDFSASGTAYHVAVPNGVIVLNVGATAASATTSFDPNDNDWDVSAPASGAGDVFMGGVALPVPNGLPGNIKNVTWSADFWCDTANVSGGLMPDIGQLTEGPFTMIVIDHARGFLGVVPR